MCTTGALKALIYIAEPQAKGATYLFDAFFFVFNWKKPGRFEEKSGKTQSSKLK
jgi:hypothetical protein